MTRQDDGESESVRQDDGEGEGICQDDSVVEGRIRMTVEVR